MSTLTIRLPDEKHDRLKALASARHISVNKLIDELATVGLVEHDAHLRFMMRAKRGNPADGLMLLDKLAQSETAEDSNKQH